ncbi:MAG: hypothetical protein ACRYFS_00750 [Janthinobacterium lividum]
MAFGQNDTFLKRYMVGNISTAKDKRTLNLISFAGQLIFNACVILLLYWIYKKVSSSDAVAVCVFGIFICGTILYSLRSKARLWYGLLEVVSALFIGWFTLTRSIHFRHIKFSQFAESPNSLATMLGLVSSVYIVVRGLDNVAEGIKRNKEARWIDATEEP